MGKQLNKNVGNYFSACRFVCTVAFDRYCEVKSNGHLIFHGRGAKIIRNFYYPAIFSGEISVIINIIV